MRIAALYDALAQVTGSPVVELNRAMAVAMAFGPESGLEIVDGLSDERSLQTYHLLWSVRGDLLSRLGRHAEAGRGVRARRGARAQRPRAGRARRTGSAEPRLRARSMIWIQTPASMR